MHPYHSSNFQKILLPCRTPMLRIINITFSASCSVPQKYCESLPISQPSPKVFSGQKEQVRENSSTAVQPDPPFSHGDAMHGAKIYSNYAAKYYL